AQIVAVLVLLVWLRFVLETPALIFGPAADAYRLAPVWQRVLIPTVLIFVVSIIQAAINLVRPDWTRLPLLWPLVTEVAGLGILIYVLTAGRWVVLASPGSAGVATLDTINQFVYYSMLSTAAGFIAAILIDGWRLLRSERKQAA